MNLQFYVEKNKYLLQFWKINCQKPKNPNNLFGFLVVVPPGIEPGTQGFSVLCSTN